MENTLDYNELLFKALQINYSDELVCLIVGNDDFSEYDKNKLFSINLELSIEEYVEFLISVHQNSNIFRKRIDYYNEEFFEIVCKQFDIDSSVVNDKLIELCDTFEESIELPDNIKNLIIRTRLLRATPKFCDMTKNERTELIEDINKLDEPKIFRELIPSIISGINELNIEDFIDLVKTIAPNTNYFRSYDKSFYCWVHEELIENNKDEDLLTLFRDSFYNVDFDIGSCLYDDIDKNANREEAEYIKNKFAQNPNYRHD